MPSNEFMLALNALCSEREVSKDVVLDAIETALHAAYRRDFEHDPNVTVTMDRATGEAKVFLEWRVVERVEDSRTEMSLEEARSKFGPKTQPGELVHEERTPKNFGRIAAQTAKQVILQRIREAERDRLYHDYASRENEIVVGTVQSIDSKTGAVRLSLGKAEAILPRSEQLPSERYRIGQRVRAFVSEVNRANRGPQITVSRTHRHMLRRLLELEVPEISNGTVEIRAIAREAGARSKVAVAALQAGIDPVGACVGMKGIRIQSIVNELNGEKIDVVQWSPDEALYVANALSPAKVIEAFLEEDNEEGKTAIVVVPDKQLSLAIGKEGQNARLAAKLTGWRIDIKSASEATDERVRLTEREARRREEEATRRREEEARLQAARALLAEAEALGEEESGVLEPAGFGTVEELAFGKLDLPFEDEIEIELTEEVARAEQPPVPAPTPVVAQPQPTPPPTAQPIPPMPTAQPTAPAQPKAQPKPAAQPQPPQPPKQVPQPVVVDDEDDEDEADEKGSGKSKTPMIFYTLNARGEAEALDDLLERKKRDKKEQRKKGGAAGQGQSKQRRGRRSWSEGEENW